MLYDLHFKHLFSNLEENQENIFELIIFETELKYFINLYKMNKLTIDKDGSVIDVSVNINTT